MNTEAKIKKQIIFFASHTLIWAVLYGAFALHLEGALNVLRFIVWSMVPLSVMLLPPDAIAAAAKTPAAPVHIALSTLQAWAMLGLLLWFGHIATASAWAFVMLMVAAYRHAVRKARADAQDAQQEAA